MKKTIFALMFTLACGSFVASCGNVASTNEEKDAVDSLAVVEEAVAADTLVEEVAAEVAADAETKDAE